MVYLQSSSRSIAVLAPNEIQGEWFALYLVWWKRAEFFKSLYSSAAAIETQNKAMIHNARENEENGVQESKLFTALNSQFDFESKLEQTNLTCFQSCMSLDLRNRCFSITAIYQWYFLKISFHVSAILPPSDRTWVNFFVCAEPFRNQENWNKKLRQPCAYLSC